MSGVYVLCGIICLGFGAEGDWRSSCCEDCWGGVGAGLGDARAGVGEGEVGGRWDLLGGEMPRSGEGVTAGCFVRISMGRAGVGAGLGTATAVPDLPWPGISM